MLASVHRTLDAPFPSAAALAATVNPATAAGGGPSGAECMNVYIHSQQVLIIMFRVRPKDDSVINVGVG